VYIPILLLGTTLLQLDAIDIFAILKYIFYEKIKQVIRTNKLYKKLTKRFRIKLSH
jgi:hypothetical protein